MSDLNKECILKSAEKLKSTIESCQVENYRLMNLLQNIKFTKSSPLSFAQANFSGASGDTLELNRNGKSSKTQLSVKLTQQEYLSMLIRKASEENLKLRESNVKLKQESKVQDQKLRDLNHKMKQYERNLHEKKLQKVVIDDLKTSIDKKNCEIRRLTQNLEDTRVLLIKEQNKAKDLKERQKISASKLKTNREIKSKVESLLLQLDLLLKNQDQSNPIICFSDSYFNKIQSVLNKLVFMKSKMTKRDVKDIPAEILKGNDLNESGIKRSKAEKCTKVSDINALGENPNLIDFTISEMKMDSKCYFNENPLSIITPSKMKHTRNNSI